VFGIIAGVRTFVDIFLLLVMIEEDALVVASIEGTVVYGC
jgi:hypothetical protein